LLSNSHFALAVHFLCALSWNEGQVIGSGDIARSMGTNPSFLRGLIGDLRKAGLVKTRQGKGGGSLLARSPKSITLYDVYLATETQPVVKSHTPDCQSACPVARNMEKVLSNVNQKLEDTLITELKKTTVADLVAQHIT
jgi:Rrf2 family protein